MTINHGHILVADDNPVNRKLLTRALQEQGYTVVTAEDGQQALEALQQNRRPSVDVVLLDILMPEMDGYQALAPQRSGAWSTIAPSKRSAQRRTGAVPMTAE